MLSYRWQLNLLIAQMVRNGGERLIPLTVCLIYHIYLLTTEVIREPILHQSFRNMRRQMSEGTQMDRHLARFSKLPILSLDICWEITLFITRKYASHLLGWNNIVNMCRTVLPSEGRMMFPIRRLCFHL